MTNPADPHPHTPVPDAAPPALSSFARAGWTIKGSPAAWTATLIRGPRSRVIAANSAAELLDKLIAAQDDEPSVDTDI